MRGRRDSLEIILGGSVLLGIVFLILVWGGISYFHRADRVVLLADFDSVEGLKEGSPVKISGVVVGSVGGITLDSEGYSAIVSFSIEKGIPLPRDTMAAIVSESLLGGKTLALVPGSEEEVLSEGEVISLTQSSINLEGLIQKVIFNVDGDKNTDAEKKAMEPHGAESSVEEKNQPTPSQSSPPLIKKNVQKESSQKKKNGR